MSQTPSLFDNALSHLHYNGARAYTHREGDIKYLDGSRLARPADMPRAQMVIAAIFVIAGIVIGGIILNNTVISAIRENLTAEQTIKDNLARQASIETVPQMSSMINLDDDAIRGVFANAGYEIYDASALYDSNNMTLYRIPSDMKLDEAKLLFSHGMGSLTAQEATKLLVGSWFFSTDRVNGTSMVTRYADFSTGDPDIAVRNALEKQGFDPNSITDTGVDESQNTYSIGSLDADGTPCTWKISALKLSDMYSISGLPEDACYVGVRVTAA